MEKTWTVVHFELENSVEAVPSTWLYENKCYWPPFAKEKIYKYIKNNDEPNTCWPLHSVKIFQNSTYDNYLTARNKARRAEETSDLNSDSDNKSHRRKTAAKILSSSESESDGVSSIPTPPPFFKKANPGNHSQILSKNVHNKEIGLNTINTIPGPVPVTSDGTNNVCVCCKQHPGHIMGDIIRKQTILQQFMKQINDNLEEIKIKIENLTTGNPAKASVSDSSNSFLKKFDFPLNSEEELNRFNNYLEDPENFKQVVTEVSKLGGNSLYEFIRRALSLCITNRLAEEYTYFGKNGKKKFSNLKIKDILVDSAHILRETTVKEIEENIRKWLRRAKERK